MGVIYCCQLLKKKAMSQDYIGKERFQTTLCTLTAYVFPLKTAIHAFDKVLQPNVV